MAHRIGLNMACLKIFFRGSERLSHNYHAECEVSGQGRRRG